MHQLCRTPSMSTNDEAVRNEPTAIDEDWHWVARSSETASAGPTQPTTDETKKDPTPPGPFLPLTGPALSAPQASYAAQLKSGLAEENATTTAYGQVTASIKAQRTDLANVVKKLNQERELLAKERKRLQEKNVTEQSELHAQLNRQVIAMHNSVVAKTQEEKQKLHDRLKAGLSDDLAEMTKEFQAALDGEAKKHRRLIEESQGRIEADNKAQDSRIAGVEQQHRALTQWVSSTEQRLSSIEKKAWSPRSPAHDRGPNLVQQDRCIMSASAPDQSFSTVAARCQCSKLFSAATGT